MSVWIVLIDVYEFIQVDSLLGCCSVVVGEVFGIE